MLSPLQQSHNKAVFELIAIQQSIMKVLRAARFSEGMCSLQRAFVRIPEYRGKALRVRELFQKLTKNGETPADATVKQLAQNNDGMLFRHALSDLRDATLYATEHRLQELHEGKYTLLDALVATSAAITGRGIVATLAEWRRLQSDDDAVRWFADKLVNITAQQITVVDLETTARSPLQGEIVEFGAVRGVVEDPIAEWDRISLLSDNAEDEVGAEYIHGIGKTMVANKPKFSNKMVQKFLTKTFHNSEILVAHNATAEWNWLTIEVPGFFERFVDEVGLRRGIDTALLSQFFIQGCGNSLSDFSTAVGVKHQRDHHALSDAMVTAVSLQKLCKVLREREDAGRLFPVTEVAPVPDHTDLLTPTPYPKFAKSLQNFYRV